MAFDQLLAVIVFIFALVGHVGIWVCLYNRINATGLQRTNIKRIEKGIFLAFCLIPIFIVAYELQRHDFVELFIGAFCGTFHWSFSSKLYGVGAASAGIAMAPFWVRDRPQFVEAKRRFQVLESHDIRIPLASREQGKTFVEGRSFRTMARLPGNQITSLQRNYKRLDFESLPPEIENLKVAHLSDLHLTGQLSTAFYRLAIDWLIDQKPDLLVMSGDIVDYATALKQMKPVFEGLSAPYGMYFILGNHDRRLANPQAICKQLIELGWIDLGVADSYVVRGNTIIHLQGNELPWFNRMVSTTVFANPSPHGENAPKVWSIGVAHSPDQFRWGVQRGCHLILCGHTHGGQIRFPIIGPIVAPSYHGSRYASGVFADRNSLMHVSRGVSGVHPFRWGCIPEVTILQMKKAEAT